MAWGRVLKRVEEWFLRRRRTFPQRGEELDSALVRVEAGDAPFWAALVRDFQPSDWSITRHGRLSETVNSRYLLEQSTLNL